MTDLPAVLIIDDEALENAPLREAEKEPVSVQHIVRSFDPCMVCKVH